ncbi:hypothetical protein [Streptomyces otsuchiensis]|uniref:hypothetical protein n=1 Tax=Streptomyces otsuchiensis TaxID=2681388 RepID=UPI001030036E|nr:hypothetical protein [Streptomyces otsuchiensis]
MRGTDMAGTEDFRKTIGNSSAVHFAAGTMDLAAEKLRGLPATFDKLKAEAPGRVQEFRENELPRLREQAQSFAQQGAETAREYAAKARETYGELAERGRGPVEEWVRSGAEKDEPAEGEKTEVVVERVESVTITEVPDDASSLTGDVPDTSGDDSTGRGDGPKAP